MGEVEVGKVTKFFSKVSVGAIEVSGDGFAVGDELHFKGATTDFTQTVESMEVENQKVERANAGDLVGIKVSERVRPGDKVFLVTPE